MELDAIGENFGHSDFRGDYLCATYSHVGVEVGKQLAGTQVR